MDSTVNRMTFASQTGGDSVCTAMHILYSLCHLQGLACLGLEMKLMFVLTIRDCRGCPLDLFETLRSLCGSGTFVFCKLCD